MTRAEISAGICGFTTSVEASGEGPLCRLDIVSDCTHVQRLAERLKEVDPFREITFRGDGPLTLRIAAECCRHPACPVPTGVLKAVEVESGLALPSDVTITLSR